MKRVIPGHVLEELLDRLLEAFPGMGDVSVQLRMVRQTGAPNEHLAQLRLSLASDTSQQLVHWERMVRSWELDLARDLGTPGGWRRMAEHLADQAVRELRPELEKAGMMAPRQRMEWKP